MVPDAAFAGFLRIYLFFKGFHSVQCARVAHFWWNQPNGSGRWIALALQSEMSDAFGVDIHPAARWGRGITMDHGTGCVIGETAVIGDNVYIMHDVTLGATGASLHHARRTEMAGMGGLNIESVNRHLARPRPPPKDRARRLPRLQVDRPRKHPGRRGRHCRRAGRRLPSHSASLGTLLVPEPDNGAPLL